MLMYLPLVCYLFSPALQRVVFRVPKDVVVSPAE